MTKQMKEQTPINIQTELTRMYSQYGWSEMFLYKAQLLFESELDKKTNAKVLEALEPIRKEIQEIKNINQSMKIDLKLAKSLLKE